MFFLEGTNSGKLVRIDISQRLRALYSNFGTTFTRCTTFERTPSDVDDAKTIQTHDNIQLSDIEVTDRGDGDSPLTDIRKSQRQKIHTQNCLTDFLCISACSHKVSSGILVPALLAPSWAAKIPENGSFSGGLGLGTELAGHLLG